MNFDKDFAIGLSLLILVQAYAVRRLTGTWMAPGSIFGLFWFAITFVPLIAFYDFPVDPFCIGFILLSTIAFSLGALVFAWKLAKSRNACKEDPALTYG